MARALANKVLGVAGIALLVLTMVNSITQVDTMRSPKSVLRDRSFIAVMNNISALVPPGSVIVVSTNGPFVTYFTGHIAKVPFGVSSLPSLVEYMKGRHCEYLLVFEGDSQNPELSSLFSSKHLRSLETSFQLMGTFQSDFSHIYLYKLIDSR